MTAIFTRWMRAFRREPFTGLGLLVVGAVFYGRKDNREAVRDLFGLWLSDREQPYGPEAEAARRAAVRRERDKLFGR
jgi:hypothetical protein